MHHLENTRHLGFFQWFSGAGTSFMAVLLAIQNEFIFSNGEKLTEIEHIMKNVDNTILKCCNQLRMLFICKNG
jgi:hypothetical protein